MTHPLPHGPTCLNPWRNDNGPTHSVLNASFLPSGLVLCKVAMGISGKQKCWRWTLLEWQTPVGTSAAFPGWRIVGQTRQSAGNRHNLHKWWVGRMITRVSNSNNEFWEQVKGEAYDALAAQEQMVHMAEGIYP